MKLTAKRRKAAEKALTAGFAKTLRYVQLRVAERAAEAATTIVASAPGQDNVPTIAGLPLATAAASINPAVVYDPRWWRAGYNRYARKPARTLYDDTAARAADELGVDYDPDDPGLAGAWDELDDVDVDAWGAGLGPFVEGQVADGVAEGDTVSDLVARLRDSAESWFSPSRALLLAAVATATTYNRSTLASATSAQATGGVRSTKTWVTVGDERVRPAHVDMDGVTVDAADDFLVEGQYPAAGPHDPRLPVELVANCRCWLTLSGSGVAEDDETATIDFGPDDADGDLVASAQFEFDPEQHPRHPAGTPDGGKFLSAGDEADAGGGDEVSVAGGEGEASGLTGDALIAQLEADGTMYRRDTNPMPDAARVALNSYILGSGKFNRPLRGGGDEPEKLEAQWRAEGDDWAAARHAANRWADTVALADGAVPLGSDAVLWRGVGPRSFDGAPQAGDVYTEDAFMSTSYDRDSAEKFAAYRTDRAGYQMEVRVPAGTPVVAFGPEYGANEREIILAPGAQYRIAEVRPSTLPNVQGELVVDIVGRDTASDEAARERAAYWAQEAARLGADAKARRAAEPPPAPAPRPAPPRAAVPVPLRPGESDYARLGRFADWDETQHPRGPGGRFGPGDAAAAAEPPLVGAYQLPLLAGTTHDPDMHTGPVPNPLGAAMDLDHYQGYGHVAINRYLRADADDPYADLQKIAVNQITREIDANHAVPHPVTAWRTFDTDTLTLTPGTRFTDKGFTSTDLNGEMATTWRDQTAPNTGIMAIRVPEGTRGIARDVGEGRELILQRGTTYEVRRQLPAGDGPPMWELDVVDQRPKGKDPREWATRRPGTFAEWDPDKHPRGDDGRFGPGSEVGADQVGGGGVGLLTRPAPARPIPPLQEMQRATVPSEPQLDGKTIDRGDRPVDRRTVGPGFAVYSTQTSDGYTVTLSPSNLEMFEDDEGTTWGTDYEETAAASNKVLDDGMAASLLNGVADAYELDPRAGGPPAVVYETVRGYAYGLVDAGFAPNFSRASVIADNIRAAVHSNDRPPIVHVLPAVMGRPFRENFHVGGLEDHEDRVAGVMGHEYGHVRMNDQVQRSPADGLQARKKIDRLYNEAPDQGLSDYGQENPAEAYAEAYADWHLTRGTTINNTTATYADELGWRDFDEVERALAAAAGANPDVAVVAPVGPSWAVLDCVDADGKPYSIIVGDDPFADLDTEPEPAEMSALGLGRFADWDPAKHPKGPDGRWAQSEGEGGSGDDKPEAEYADVLASDDVDRLVQERWLLDAMTREVVDIPYPPRHMTRIDKTGTAIARRLGNDGLPTVVPIGELDAMLAEGRAKEYMARGLEPNDGAGVPSGNVIPAATLAEQFRSGEHFVTAATHGSGTYAGYGPDADSVASPYAREDPAAIVRMAFKPDAKIIDLSSAKNAATTAWYATDKAAQEAKAAGDKQRYLDMMQLGWVVSDPGRWAAMHGYDAVRASGVLPEGRGEMLILNRRALVVEEAPDDATMERTRDQWRRTGVPTAAGLGQFWFWDRDKHPRHPAGSPEGGKFLQADEATDDGGDQPEVNVRPGGDAELTHALASDDIDQVASQRWLTALVPDASQPAGGAGWGLGQNEALAAMAERLGAAGPPDLVDPGRLDAVVDAGGTYMARGVSAPPDGRSAAALSEEFRTGPPFYGAGMIGSGIYTAYADGARDQGWADTLGNAHANNEPGGLVRMALKADANVIDLPDIGPRQRQLLNDWRGEVDKAADAGDTARAADYQAAVDLMSNVGTWSLAHGYDAVRWPEMGFMVLLDRGQVVAERARVGPDGQPERANLTALGVGQFDFDADKHPRDEHGRWAPSEAGGGDGDEVVALDAGTTAPPAAPVERLTRDDPDVVAAAERFAADYGVTLNVEASPYDPEPRGIPRVALEGVEASVRDFEGRYPGLLAANDTKISLVPRIVLGSADGGVSVNENVGGATVARDFDWGTGHPNVTISAKYNVTDFVASSADRRAADTERKWAQFGVGEYDTDPARYMTYVMDHELTHSLHYADATQSMLDQGLQPPQRTGDARDDRISQEAWRGRMERLVREGQDGEELTALWKPEQDRYDAALAGRRAYTSAATVEGSPSRYAMTNKAEWLAENFAAAQRGEPSHPDIVRVVDAMYDHVRRSRLTAGTYAARTGVPAAAEPAVLDVLWERRPGEAWPAGYEPPPAGRELSVLGLGAFAEWDPEKHPRGPGGRFGDGGVTADTVQHQVFERGGVTMRRVGGAVPDAGFVVSERPELSLPIPKGVDADAHRQQLDRWMADHKAVLDEPGNFVGGWLDPDDGTVYYDVVRVYPPEERDAAVAAGQNANQIAIWDIGADDTINTGGSGTWQQDQDKAAASGRCIWLRPPTSTTCSPSSKPNAPPGKPTTRTTSPPPTSATLAGLLGAFDFDPAKHPKDEKGRWAEVEGDAAGGEEHHWWQKLIPWHHDEPEPPPDEEPPPRDAEAVAAFASNDPKRIVELDWLHDIPDTAVANAQGLGVRDQHAAVMAHHLGVDGPPAAVVGQQELARLAFRPGAMYAVRGVHESASMSAAGAAETFRTGPAWYSLGVLGSGTYAAYTGGTGATGSKTSKAEVDKTAAGYAGRGTSGATVSMVVSPDARIASYDEARREAQKVSYAAKDEAAKARRDGDPALAQRYQNVASVMADPGRWALANGYDAIVQPREGYMTILNRAPVTVGQAGVKVDHVAVAASAASGDWDPAKHPRGEGGRFGEAEGDADKGAAPTGAKPKAAGPKLGLASRAVIEAKFRFNREYGVALQVTTPVTRVTLDAVEKSVAGFDGRFPGVLAAHATVVSLNDELLGDPVALGMVTARGFDEDGLPKMSVEIAVAKVEESIAQADQLKLSDIITGYGKWSVGCYETDPARAVKIVTDHELGHALHAAYEGARMAEQEPGGRRPSTGERYSDTVLRNSLLIGMRTPLADDDLSRTYKPIADKYKTDVGDAVVANMKTAAAKDMNADAAAATVPGSPTRYAMTNMTEWVAENTSALLNGEPHHPDIGRILDGMYRATLEDRDRVAAAAVRIPIPDDPAADRPPPDAEPVDTYPIIRPGQAWPDGYAPAPALTAGAFEFDPAKHPKDERGRWIDVGLWSEDSSAGLPILVGTSQQVTPDTGPVTSSEAAAAVDRFQTYGAQRVNTPLRERGAVTADAATLTAEIDRHAVPEAITVWRNFNPDRLTVRGGLRFTDHGFVSTDTEGTTAREGGRFGTPHELMAIRVPAGTRGLYQTSKQGEHDLILQRGTTYEVKGHLAPARTDAGDDRTVWEAVVVAQRPKDRDPAALTVLGVGRFDFDPGQHPRDANGRFGEGDGGGGTTPAGLPILAGTEHAPVLDTGPLSTLRADTAVGRYQGYGYTRVNGALRSGNFAKPVPEIVTLTREIDLHEVPHDTTVYRNVDTRAFPVAAGKTWTDRGFTSTDTGGAAAVEFSHGIGVQPPMALLAIRVEAGSRGVTATKVLGQGDDVAGVERELILQRDSTFEVVGRLPGTVARSDGTELPVWEVNLIDQRPKGLDPRAYAHQEARHG